MAYSTINKPTDYFNTVLWTGNSDTTRNITGVGFQPDLSWVKNRSLASDHRVHDAVRGANKGLVPNGTDAEDSSTTAVKSFLSDGIQIGNEQSFNRNGDNHVGWFWKANGSGSSNTDGSITSSVSANTTAGFSIVKWTSSSGSDTIGHGLNSAPEIIHTNRLAATESWSSHTSIVDGSWDYLRLNTTDGKGDSSYTAPTNSVFYYNYGSVHNFISYCFHSVKGFSKIGKFTSIGNDDGAFIYTGFKPALVMIKPNATDGWSHWYVFDYKRDHAQLNDGPLYWNLNTQEGYYGGSPASNYSQIDILSNGFKIRRDGNWGVGGNGQQCLYYAIAAQPLVGTNKVAATAF